MINYTDSSAAMSIIASDSGSWWTRHLRKRAHGLRTRIQQGDWMIRHIPGAEMAADLGTKVLPMERFNQLKVLMGMQTEESQPKREEGIKEGGREDLKKALKAMILVAQFMMAKGDDEANETNERGAQEGENLSDTFTWNQVVWMMMCVAIVFTVIGGAVGTFRRNAGSAPEEEEDEGYWMYVSGPYSGSSESEEEVSDRPEEVNMGLSRRRDRRNLQPLGPEQVEERDEGARRPPRNPPRMEGSEPSRAAVAKVMMRPPPELREGDRIEAYLITPCGRKYHRDRDCYGLRNATAVFQAVKCTECEHRGPGPVSRFWSLGCGYMLHNSATHVRPPQTVQEMRPYDPCALCIGRNP